MFDEYLREGDKLGNKHQTELASLEAILFAAGDPAPITQLAKVLNINETDTKALCEALQNRYEETGSGIRVQVYEDRVQLTTAPGTAKDVEAFLGIKSASKLSRAALETLTIVAYRQPISRPAVDAIRGVSSDYVLHGLLNRGLIEEDGRAETPGRPVFYKTTQDFLLYFGLSSIQDLPPFEVKQPVSEEADRRILKE